MFGSPLRRRMGRPRLGDRHPCRDPCDEAPSWALRCGPEGIANPQPWPATLRRDRRLSYRAHIMRNAGAWISEPCGSFARSRRGLRRSSGLTSKARTTRAKLKLEWLTRSFGMYRPCGRLSWSTGRAQILFDAGTRRSAWQLRTGRCADHPSALASSDAQQKNQQRQNPRVQPSTSRHGDCSLTKVEGDVLAEVDALGAACTGEPEPLNKGSTRFW